MSVVGAGVKLLFCEGKPTSLDAALLDNLVTSTSTLLVPAGGKGGLPSFIEGRLSTYGASPPDYLAFRDRDFDSEPSDRPRLIPSSSAKPIFLTYRTCVENYLIDAQLIHDFWTQYADAPGWRHGDSPGEEQISQWVEEAARDISAYQAVRWALGGLKPDQGWPGVPTTWESRESLPASLDYENCLRRASELVTRFRRDTDGITADLLSQGARGYRERFEDGAFWSEKQYLIWFHGKDLAKRLQARLPFINEGFYKWATAPDHFDWRSHPDLRELAEKVN